MAKIAMLHTSFVFLNVDTQIQDLIGSLLPEDELIHFVDSDVLASVVRDGGISPSSEERMLHLAQAAERAGADVIFSACSSLGPAMDAAKAHVGIPIVKVDDAMTRDAAMAGGTVGVLATVPTTLAPTADLIRLHARDAGREIQVFEQLAAGAFDVLMNGDREAHDEMVRQSALELVDRGVDQIVLAQASMARLAGPLGELTGIPVLASPKVGVENLAELVRSGLEA
ncbi:aspartate/glutamate racemase family protein [Glaciibacter superstes]|uniref:aspartate/glutamate racemase family protein n=1 Tax=Glaciibacter superstes TaxID=501023 RepID=UPI0003B3E524|nr:aspartate/glutamate racemase family protein [Glaciibacter superstes]